MRVDIFFFFAIALYLIAYAFWGEIIPIGQGFGYDGQQYGLIAYDFYNQIFVVKKSIYITKRALPSGLIHYSLRALDIPLTAQSVLMGFRIYSAAAISFATLFFGLILGHFKINERVRAIGYASLFINFGVLKCFAYNPAHTDPAALALGTMLFYFFITERMGWLLFTLLLGYFTWPSMIYGGILLFLLPKEKFTSKVRHSKLLGVVCGASITAIILADLLYYYYVLGAPTNGIYGTVPVVQSVFYLSVLGMLSQVFFMNREIFSYYPGKVKPWHFLWSIKYRLILSLILVLGLHYLVLLVADTSKFNPWTIKTFFSAVSFSATTRPLITLVAHGVFLGPVIALIIFKWRDIVKEVAKLGPGMQLFFAFNGLLTIQPETRIFINFFPVLVAFLAVALNAQKISRTFVVGYVILCLAFSKVWYFFDLPRGIDQNTMLQFPLQRYFMNFGPWMINYIYCIHGTLVLLMVALFFYLYRRRAY